MDIAPQIAIQLYSLRQEAELDFGSVLERVARVGYSGVEIAGFHGMAVSDFSTRLGDLGLQVVAAHIDFDSEVEHALDDQEVLGNRRIVTSLGPEYFESPSTIDKAAGLCNQFAELLVPRGMQLGYHNHWWEFAQHGDWCPMSAFIERLDPDVFFEIDVYWAQTAGLDPAQVVSELGRRAALLHLKDGSCNVGDPQTALGTGVVDIPAVISAGRYADWHIVELDECAGSMFTAVEASYRYLADLDPCKPVLGSDSLE